MRVRAGIVALLVSGVLAAVSAFTVAGPAPARAAAPGDPATAEAALDLARDTRREIQRRLGDLGFDTRGVDGQFGPATRAAIRAFQASRGIAATGFLDERTVAALAPAGATETGAQGGAGDAVAPLPPPDYPVGVGQAFRDCAECPIMVVIPAGTAEVGERTTTPVTLRAPLAVGRFPVTVGEYRAFVAATGPRGDTGWATRFPNQSERHPVVRVTWEDAQAYVAWLRERTGHGYRLLSEAEWEYAARGGTTTAYYWGDTVGRANANCDGCGSAWDIRSPSPVGSFVANPFGLHDMAGNVWQWVQDCWSDRFPGSPDAGAVTLTGMCERRVLRGGSWVSNPHYVRPGLRYWYAAANRFSNVGFRVARP